MNGMIVTVAMKVPVEPSAPRTLGRLSQGGTRLLSGNDVVVNVGTHAAILDIPEMAQAYRRFGSRVTIVEPAGN
jgi:hypothetical protein